jgi:hypothetical protein
MSAALLSPAPPCGFEHFLRERGIDNAIMRNLLR